MLRRTQTLQLPKIMELVGLGYSSWFVYRYLLFKVRRPSRAAARATRNGAVPFVRSPHRCCRRAGEPQGAGG